MDYLQNLGLVILPVIFLLSSAFASDHPRTGYACEGSTLTVSCGPGEVIKVQSANYGRLNVAVCNNGGSSDGWSIPCFSRRSIRVVADSCDDKPSCSVVAHNIVFGGDACPNTSKYLEIEYTCPLAPVVTTTTSTTTPIPPTTTTQSTTTSKTTTPTTTKTSTKRTTTTTTMSTSSLAPETTTVTTTGTTTPTTTTPPPGVVTPGRVVAPAFCPATERRNITWPKSLPGQEVRRPCPNNPQGEAYWTCRTIGWETRPDLSRCVSNSIKDFREKVRDSKQIDKVVEVIEEISTFSNQQTLEFGGDLAEMADILREVANSVETEVLNVTQPVKEKAVKKVNRAILETSSNLLNEARRDSWQDIPQSDQAAAATDLISALEESATMVADTINQPKIVINVDLNIVMEVNVIATNAGQVEDVVFPKEDTLQRDGGWKVQGDSIRLTGNTIKSFGVDGLAKLIFLTYNNLEQLMNPEHKGGPSASEHGNNRDLSVKYKPAPKPRGDGDSLNDGEDGGTAEAEDVAYKTEESSDEIEEEEDNENTIDNDDDESEKKKVKQIVNSNIISASINGRKEMRELPEPITYTLEHKTTDNVYNPTCSFWEYSEQDFDGHWSTFGCDIVETNVTHTTCQCSHLTNFAILMDVHGTALPSHHKFGLDFITYFGCMLSILCLFLSWMTFQFFKNLQCDRNTIHKNLVVCLCVAELIFLGGIVQYEKPVLCSVIAGFLHYFFLAAFSWMCLEGIQLYVMLIEVFEAEKSRIIYYYFGAYGVPAVIVGISAAVDHTGYGTEYHCWLNAETGFIWAFVGPVICVLLVNMVMLSIAIYMMCRHAHTAASMKMKEKSKLENVRSWLKGASVLVVLLGLTWLFGLLYINAHSVFMAYIFTLLNSLQGVFIYVFHCLMNEKVQKEYKRCVRRMKWLPDCVRVNYGGAKVNYTSTSPQNSSSGTGNYLQKLLSGRRRKRSSTTTLSSKRTSTPSARWLFQNRNSRETTPMMENQNGGPFVSEPTEDADGYLEPIKIRVDDSYLGAPLADPELSMIDNSCIDGRDLAFAFPNAAPLNIEKYKIRSPNLLSAIDNDRPISESEYSDGDLFNMTDREKNWTEYEQQPLQPCTESDQELVDETLHDSTLALKKPFPASDNDSCSKDCPSINDLNKSSDSDNSKHSMHLSTPNIKSKTDSLKRDNRASLYKDPSLQRSLPNIAGRDSGFSEEVGDRLRKALSNDDGLITLYEGNK